MENFEIKGFSFGFMEKRGGYTGETARHSLDLLYENGTRWIALCVNQFMDTVRSTDVRFNYNKNVTDVELIEFIKYARNKGMKICLKPMIELTDRNWRADINFWDDEGSWAKYFYEYTGFITHYAEIAEYTGCEMLCLGCEMLGMERQEEHWRKLIKKVREYYSGKLTYNTNHGAEFVANWYDELDYIGTSAYYRMHKIGQDPHGINPYQPIMDLTYEDMMASWAEVKERMEKFYDKWKKPIIFMEIGCRSARGCACQPWDFKMTHLPYDEDEQALFYETCMETFKQTEWFSGFFWWDWKAKVSEKTWQPGNLDFAIYKKKAEDVIRKYYAE